MKTLASLLLFLIGLAATAAASLEQAIEPDLYYLRIVNIDTELPAAAAAWTHPALILDLRYAEGTPDAVALLAQRIAQVPTVSRAHRLVLLSPASPPQLVEMLSHGLTGVLTIGPRSPVAVDIPVEISVSEDQKAFEAAQKGMPLEKLFSQTVEKRRYDEAALAHSRISAGQSADDDPDSLPEPTPSPEPAKTEPSLPHDAVLQRAVQIHQGLEALKK